MPVRPRRSIQLFLFPLLLSFVLCGDSLLAQPSQTYTDRLKITIDNSGQSTALTDFPLLVILDAPEFDATATRSDGGDLEFLDDDDTTRLSHEIDGSWDNSGTNPNYVWVKVPTIDAASDTDFIYLYYGNASAAAGNDTTDVWSNGFLAVFHFNEDPSGAILDSTSNNNDGTSTGMDSADLVDGLVGKALDFDGTNDRIDVTSLTPNPGTSDITAVAWFRLSAATTANQIFLSQTDGGGGTGRAWLYKSGNTMKYRMNLGGASYDHTSKDISLNTWHHGALSSIQGTSIFSYLDGVGENAGATGETNTGFVKIGTGKTNTQYWTGLLDEVRISNVARTDDWITAAYLNSQENSTYVSYQDDPAGPADDADSTITASATLTEPATIDSIDTGQDIAIFDFTITDLGTTDGAPTKIDAIAISTESSAGLSTIDAEEHAWKLTSTTILTTEATGTVSGSFGSAQTITFTFIPAINVPDMTAETFTLSVRILEDPADPTDPNTPDNGVFYLSIDDTGVDTPPGVAGTNTTMETGQAEVNNGVGTIFEVTATKLSVVSSTPSAVEKINEAFNVEVAYTDVAGLRDLDIAGDSLDCARSDTSASVASATAIAGLVRYTGVNQILLGPPGSSSMMLEFTDDAGGSINLSASTYTSNSFKLLSPPTITGISPTSGPIAGGTEVTITGTDLDFVIWVTFGNIAGTALDIVNSTTLTVVTPARDTAELVDVVISDGAFSDSLTDAFTYGTPGSGLPSIALITPDSGYAEGGDSVTITGENLASPLAVTFNGVASTIISSTSSRIDVRTPAGPIDTDVDVRVTTTAGSDTVFGGFRYLSLTAPSISSTGAGAQAGGIGICSLHWNGGWVAAFIALSSCALSLFTRRRDKAAQ